jgi:hypothetical protein
VPASRQVELGQEIVKVIEQFPKVHKFLTTGDTGCHPQHLIDAISGKLVVRENILIGMAAQLKAELDEALAEIDRLKKAKRRAIR